MRFDLQLARLILDFYRENKHESQQLQVLKQCRIRRRWWREVQIHCPNRKIAEQLAEAQSLLADPLAQLNLARKIRILAADTSIADFPAKAHQHLPDPLT